MTARFTADQLSLSESRPAPNWREYAEETAAAIALPCLAGTESAVATAIASDEVFVPERYESNYAYPLIVWLLPADAPAGTLRRLMLRISERNCFGLSLACREDEFPEAHLYEAVSRLRRRWHLHTERIYLAGRGNLAVSALQWGLARPEWFAGAVALSPERRNLPGLLSRFDELRGKHVFLSETGHDPDPADEALARLHRLLWTAGLSVTGCCVDSRNSADEGVLRELNRWLIATMEQPEPVR